LPAGEHAGFVTVSPFESMHEMLRECDPESQVALQAPHASGLQLYEGHTAGTSSQRSGCLVVFKPAATQ